MLVPAITRKEEIVQASQKLFYTEDYFYYMGDASCYPINIKDNTENGYYQWASVDKDGNLIGYIAYNIDFYTMCAYNFGLISFDKGNMVLAKDLDKVMQDLVDNPVIRRLEFRGIQPNPALKAYRRFCEKFSGNEYILHDAVRDAQGGWHNEELFEVIFNWKKI